jgi:subtilisin family serine protease
MRRIAALAFALLLSLPVVAPVAAADPRHSAPSPDADPVATPNPSPDPTSAPPAFPDPTRVPEPKPIAPDPTTATQSAPPAATPRPAPAKSDARPDATGRYIVLLKRNADTAAVITRHRQREGTRPDRRYRAAFRGFAAELDAAQHRALAADPNVVTIVPDETIELAAQSNPTGISRVYARNSSVADIDGIDERVNADIAIVDTGVGLHPDLNVVGGRNCSSSDPNAWRDQHGHGTHVAGTAAALDNTIGVVGVAPGARIWAVRILNSSGSGLLSWYVCGLDWILAQRDPNDSSRPLIEAVNMSVAKSGRDDVNCGLSLSSQRLRTSGRALRGTFRPRTTKSSRSPR